MTSGGAAKAGEMPGAVRLLVELLGHPSIEVQPGRRRTVDGLHEQFDPDTEVFVNFPPQGDHAAVAETALQLRRAGFVPVPHIAARSIRDAAALRGFVARLTEEAGVREVLLIGGDRSQPLGPFASSLDLLASGGLDNAGLDAIGVAGHPERHPLVATATLEAALAKKVARITDAGAEPFIVSQFAFEAGPILAWLARIRAAGIAAPVRVGIAGPASVAALVKFGIRCGIGDTLRAVRLRTNTVGRLLGDSRPEELIHDLGAGLAAMPAHGVSGLHFFAFGGIVKTGTFIAETQSRLYGAIGSGAGRG